ncbi:hypothetical protein [Parabacteroides sp. AF48-14]|uniref:hypothetical protein n=1 Tax=Parabacteroides sp. AF48-14 TaxID=2292052 RepID=UPI0011C3B3B8|nr:hypothetical protein [Parabacteroides sp. AF48-14]
MKLKKILSGMFIVALGVTSCTSEMPVDNQGEDGASALSVVLSVGDQVTKAIDDPAGGSYGIATTKEITINDFHVAIFDGTSNQRIDAMTVKPGETGVQDATITDNGKKYSGYKVNFENVSTRDHESVYAVVIANASKTEYDVFDNCKEYSDYEGVIIKTESFDASNLAKSGMSESKTISGNTNIELLVPLTQLSARIDFGTATAATKAGSGDEITSDWSVVTSQPDDLDEAVWNALKAKAADNKSGTWEPKSNETEGPLSSFTDNSYKRRNHYNVWEAISNSYGGYYYSAQYGDWYSKDWDWNNRYRSAYYANRILLVRKKVTTTSVAPPSTSSGFNLTEASFVGNGQTIPDCKVTGNSKYRAINGSFSTNTSFYTYALPEDKDLEITLKGTFQEGSSGSTGGQTSEKWVYGIWTQSRGAGWNNVSTTPEDDSAGITWYDGKDGSPEITQEISSTKSVSTASDNSLKSGEKIYTYKFNWSDLKQDGEPVTLQRGYRYKLDVVKVDKNDFKLIVMKEPWSIQEVNVGYDSDKYK